MKQTLRELIRGHLERMASYLDNVRKVCPPDLWEVRAKEQIEERTYWLLADLVDHWTHYQADIKREMAEQAGLLAGEAEVR